ncbi:MAG: glycosyltransferase family 4 protein [Gallionellaceae bacterium]|jgi:UDP-N-acetylmuramyl pentapeptide phosphotransferase/UDP-N-acetylglucosamine-1-phosphate transferase
MNYFSPIYLSPLLAALVTIISIAIILSGKFGQGIQDIPNERSLHKTVVPRSGGVALMAGVSAGWVMLVSDLTWWITLPVLCLLVISLLDDIYNLPVKKRLLIHLGAVVLFIVGAGIFSIYGVLIALTIGLLMVWMTNLYNFMDGSDGLAGGMALFGFSFYGIAALIHQQEAFALLNFSIAAAAFGFLLSNFHPAKIFMGDAGSIPLGFLAAALGVLGWRQGLWAAWFPILVFSPFIVDASITLLKRTLRGVKITEAHREHYYQRAVQLGYGHRNVALIEYALMFAAGLSALLFSSEMILIVWGVIYTVLMLAVDGKWKNTSHV